MPDDLLLEQYEAALKAERMAWMALIAVSPLSAQRAPLQDRWHACAAHIQELSAKLNSER